LYHHRSHRSAPYSDFASTAASMTPSATPKLKKAADFTIMGQSKPRHDLPSKVDGSALFGIDVRRPGMVYAAIRRAPVFGGTLKGFDDSAARAMPGVIDIIKLDTTHSASMVGPYNASDAVAVVADSYWRAENALKALTFDWDQSDNAAVDSESIYAQFDRDISASENRQVDRVFGNPQAVLDNASITLAAEYRVPYLAHACMEPMNATAEVSSNHAEVWLGCQNPLGFRQHVAEGLDMAMEQVTLHNHIMGGGFGRRATADYALQAALIARAVGLPVQLIWSREEDIRQDFYRPAAMSRFRAALNSDGHLIAWHNTYTDKHEPREAPLIPYSVPDQDIGYIASPTPIPFGAWRSVDHSQHGFFTESFVDEVAHAAGQDPFRYRAAMLAEHPRHLAVLERVAAEADWNTPLGPNRGRGIALQKSFGSIVGQVVEVTIEAGRLRVDHVVSVIDPGFAVSPDGLKAQIESGVIYGLTAALYGEITIEAGAVVQSNFHDYRAIRMDEAPRIQTFIINSGADMGGAGEPGVPAVAPALANAIFNATGRRIRTLPLMNTDFASLG
jgi:isoquinoline 1-oxidoreductase beta subunit